jgi:hypothetical protein
MLVKRKAISSARIERWLGAERAERLSAHMKGWYGDPINLRDLPGSVWLGGDGDFCGDFDRGFFDSAEDAFGRLLQREADKWRRALHPDILAQYASVGFTSISDALARASGGNRQLLNGAIAKTGPTGVSNVASSLWRVGPMPSAGGAGSAAPGGRAPTKATAGAMNFNNPATGTLHLTGADFSAAVVNNSVMLYDRIFDVAKTMNSTATEAVTGVPTRYQSVTPTDPDSARGNFLFIEVGGTALAATAHNWTVCQYTDALGNATQTLPSVTGNSGAIVDRFDMPANNWFCPLAADDDGIKALTQMQASAAVATGAINFVIGHPIGIMCFPVINSLLPFDWLTNRDQAPRIFDDAALALFELPKPATTATTYNGIIYATSAAA